MLYRVAFYDRQGFLFCWYSTNDRRKADEVLAFRYPGLTSKLMEQTHEA